MQEPKIIIPKLTRNEQKVLRSIIDQAKIPDLEIAKTMGLSQQGIFKIRHKLEDVGIIKGYMPIIDFKKIGVETLVVLGITLTNYIWEKYSEEQITERILRIPQVITAYRIPDSNISHFLIMGFKNSNDKDKYLMKLQSTYFKEVKVVHVYPFSVDRIIKSNPIGLLDSIINQKISPPCDFFIDT